MDTDQERRAYQVAVVTDALVAATEQIEARKEAKAREHAGASWLISFTTLALRVFLAATLFNWFGPFLIPNVPHLEPWPTFGLLMLAGVVRAPDELGTLEQRVGYGLGLLIIGALGLLAYKMSGG